MRKSIEKFILGKGAPEPFLFLSSECASPGVVCSSPLLPTYGFSSILLEIMDTFVDWVREDHGVTLLGIIFGTLALYIGLRYMLPRLARRLVHARGGELDLVERDEKTARLGQVLVRGSAPVLFVGAVLAALLVSPVNLQEQWDAIVDWLRQHGPPLLLILVIFAIAYIALRRIVPSLVRRAVLARARDVEDEELKQRAETLSSVLLNTAIVILLTVGLFMVLAELGVNIGPALAGFGVVGIAVGFGAQSLVKDVISGLFILLENQYAVGDVVKVANTTGVVQEINLRRTVLRDLDGIVHSIPNGEITVASNYTKDWSRVNMNIRVSYQEDLDHVIAVVNKVGQEMAGEPYWGSIMLTPPQVLRVDAFEDSGIAIKIIGDTKQMKQWEIMGELRKRLKKRFDEEGIEIPWPHTKVFFGEPLVHRRDKEVEGTERDGERFPHTRE